MSVTPLVDAGAATDAANPTTDSGPANDAAVSHDAGPDAPPDFNTGSCKDKLATSTCNPVTGAPCTSPQSCDFNPTNGDFFCRGDAGFSFTGDVCGACDPPTKKYCKPGSTCAPNKQCVRYCCADADCMGHGACALPGPFGLPGVGVCFDELDICAAGDGGSDAASDAPNDAPDAD